MISLIIGLLIGSFLNVVVYRLPLGLSVISPPSHCLNCKRKLSGVELVPIVSYIIQKGQCKACGCTINWRYPIVEGLVGLLFLLLSTVKGSDEALISNLAFTAVLVAIAFIDLDHFYIPDKLLFAGAILWTGLRIFLPFIPVKDALLGAALGFAIMLVIYLVSRGGMGFGDVKLAALIGLYLGPASTVLTLLVSFVVGAVAGICLMLLKIRGRKDMLPFGPFLAVGAYISMLWGPMLISWYTGMIGF